MVPFDSVPVNHWSFNHPSNAFMAPVTGYYWLHMSVAIPAYVSKANVTLQGTNRIINIYKNYTSAPDGPVTTSRDAIIYLTNGTTVSMSSQYPLYSDSLLQTSFGGFLLDSIMSKVVTFAFGLSASFVCSSSPCTANIPFDVIYIDSNNGWNTTNKTYIVPVTGIYAISLVAINVDNSNPIEMAAYLTVNSVIKTFQVSTVDNSHGGGADTSAGFCMVNLHAGDAIAEVLKQGSLSTFTTFSGFLYSPNLTPAIAFSVVLNGPPWSINAPFDPVQYGSVLVNQGNGWSRASYTFTAPLGGVYYVYNVVVVKILTCVKWICY